jgi:hypothetical protein
MNHTAVLIGLCSMVNREAAVAANDNPVRTWQRSISTHATTTPARGMKRMAFARLIIEGQYRCQAATHEGCVDLLRDTMKQAASSIRVVGTC